MKFPFTLPMLGPWLYAIVLAIGVAIGGGVAWKLAAWTNRDRLATANAATQACYLARETDRANRNGRTATDLAAGIRSALDHNAATQAAADQRARDMANLMEALKHVPATKSCGASPAMRVFLDGLRKRATAAAN